MAAAPIKNVAIIGAGGRVGKHYTEALVKTGKHNVTALTRANSTSKLPQGVKTIQVDYDNEESLVSALKDQQFFIICLGVRVPEDTNVKLVKAAAKAGVKYIMPNVHGADLSAPSFEETVMARTANRVKEVEAVGLPWFLITTGFWYEWSLALGENLYGIDIKEKKAWLCDDGETPMNTTTWPRCGEALAALLSLPESGASPSLVDWKNKQVYVDSFRVTQRQILDSVQRVTGTTDKDWEITYEPAEKRYKEGMEEMNRGDVQGLAKAMYSRALYKDGTLDYESRKGLDNEKLGLQRENLDVVTKKVVDKVLNGWNPWASW
ncbi:NAD(P)-binding protein [Thozetella sp. PMI_491]|nr:NAD(P)-binding protein [Thozetella sp. PMI_491]